MIYNTYEKRKIEFLEYWKFNDWKVKVYSITVGDELLSPLLLKSTYKKAERLLENQSNNSYDVGFIGIHQGVGANFIFIDWWTNENELIHNLFVSNQQDPKILLKADPSQSIACVWDLHLINFEKEVWIDTVLKNQGKPKFESYLKKTLSQKI